MPFLREDVMGFQLVRAGDSEIAVWQVEHGHVYTFNIPANGKALVPGPFRNAPDAEQQAPAFEREALRFATDEARKRHLIA
jgi:hypothetical protein